MRRAARLASWALAAIAALPLLVAALLVAIANTDPGRRAIERTVAWASGGQVRLEGLGGRFPDRLRVERVEMRDRDGTWGSASNLALDWLPSRLLRGEARVTRVELARLALERWPAAQREAQTSRKGSTRLPVRIDIEAARVGRLELAPPLAGVAAALEIEGHVRLASASRFDLGLTVTRRDAPGVYRLEGVADATRLAAHLDLSEPSGGLAARLAGLPELGALAVKASLEGPRNAGRLQLAARAGRAQATAQGTIDLEARVLDLQIAAQAPAMRPSAELAWQGASLQGYVKGPYALPEANVQLRVRGVQAGEAGFRGLEADLTGNAGAMALRARVDGLRVPGERPDLFAAAPIRLQARARLADSARPVDFTLSHPLLAIEGHAAAGREPGGSASVTIPALAPFARAAGMALEGRTSIVLRFATKGEVTRVDVDGSLGLTGGAAPLPALIGSDAKLALAASLRGDALTVRRAQLDGRSLHLSAAGTRRGETFDFTWQSALSDLAALAPTLRGSVSAQGHARGTAHELETDARASGRLLGAPLELAANLRQERDGTLRAAIERADWKSAHADGEVTVPAAERVPRGHITLRMTRLADLQALIGQPLEGSLVAKVELVPQGARGDALVQAEARGVGVPDARAERVTLSGRIGGLPSRPSAALQLVADGIAAQGFSGNARIEANGPQDALVLKASSRLKGGDGSPAQLSAAGRLNAIAHSARVEALALEFRGQRARLLQPAVFDFADGLAVERLRIGFEGDALGTLDAQAKLVGPLARPQGKVRLELSRFRMRSGPARALPAAKLQASADLAARAAQVRARLEAGPRVQLALNGTAPLAATEPMKLRATGTLDLALANPILQADGRRAQGRATIDVGVTGPYAAPRARGTVNIADADLQDVARGARVHDIAALVQLDGDVLRIARFSGRAGRGTVSASGAVGMLEPDLPVDLAIAARDARPLASDLVTADLDMDLRVRGAARTRLDAVGQVRVKHADINIPRQLPSSVAVLELRRPGQKPPPAAESPPLAIGLDIAVDAPRAVFVRGRGLDAEMGGKLHVGGTAAAPQMSGGFELRRGTFDLAGTSLKFARGQVGFSGSGLQRKMDPTLDFLAETAARTVTARLAVTGFASAPKIALSSTPELPQDEVLARLLFGVSAKELSPLQAVQIARALATLRGAGGGKPGPLEMAQKRLGLDRLAVSGGGEGKGPSVEAGRYISERVYVGARESAGGATQARVQVDLTRRLKLETRLGTGGGTLQGATPETDPGTSVGLLYQKEY